MLKLILLRDVNRLKNYGLIAVAVATAVNEAFVVTPFAAFQVLPPCLATEFGLWGVTVLISTIVCAIVEIVIVAVFIAHFPVLIDLVRFLGGFLWR